jgi:hypothetical protein
MFDFNHNKLVFLSNTIGIKPITIEEDYFKILIPSKVFAHKLDRSQKLLFEIGEIGLSIFRNRTLWFYRDRRQSGVPPGFDEVPLLSPIDVWTKKMREPRQPKRLEWWLIDLIEEKQKKKRKLGQNYEKR